MASRAPVGRLLVEAGVLRERDVDDVLAVQVRDGGRFCSVALRLGLADERSLVRVLGKQLGVPGMVVGDAAPEPPGYDLVPATLAERLCAMPLRVFNRTLTMMMRDPTDGPGLAELQIRCGKVVRPLLALEGPLRRAIRRAYGEPEQTTPPEHAEQVLPDVPAAPIAAESTLSPLDTGPFETLAPNLTPADSRPTLLAVDDEPAILMLYAGVFDARAWRLETCPDGITAFERLRAVRPDIILLDALMPGLHGFEVCRRIKQSDVLRHIVVVLLSAGYRGWQMRADLMRQHGADDFIEKPFDPALLRERVELLLARRTGSRVSRPVVTEAVRELNAGLLLLQKGDLDAATGHFQRSARVDPFGARPHFYLGKIHERRGQPFEAMYEYEQAVLLDGSFFPAMKDLAILYQSNGFVQKAFGMWQQAMAACPDAATRDAIRVHLVNLL